MEDILNLKVKCLPHFHELKGELPSYMTKGSAGIDIRACIHEKITINPMDRCIVQTGIALELPHGFEGQIRPRSGLAHNFGITVLNSPGTIDSDYRGEIKIILMNFGKDPFTILHRDRVAQLVVSKVTRVKIETVTEITTTERDAQGFGHTGVSV